MDADHINQLSTLPADISSSGSAINWCFTGGKLVGANFKWTIANFSYKGFQKKYSFLRSPVFSADGDDQIQWQLLVTNRSNNHSQIFFELELVSPAEETPPVPTKTKFYILASPGSKKFHFQKYLDLQEFKKPEYLSFDLAYMDLRNLFDKTNGWLENDVLSIFVQIDYEKDSKTIGGRNWNTTEPYGQLQPNLSQHLERLWIDQENSLPDMTFNVKGEIIHAHKCILARSSVFQAMLQHDTKEKRENQMEIDDIEPDVFRAVIRYIYTDQTDVEDDLLSDLLIAADKYLLDGLKLHCEKLMAGLLSLENCLQVLDLADRHSACFLKASALDFIRLRTNQVVDSPAWETMAGKFDPKLFTDMFKY